MDVIKIVVIGLIFAVIIVYLQSINKEIAMLATIVAGIIILMSAVDLFYDLFSVYKNIVDIGGIDGTLLKLILKITIICYIVEFAVGIIEDFGLKSLADKVSLIGKLIVVIISAPVINSVFGIIANLIK